MMKMFFILVLLFVGHLAFCQDCPKDSTHSFYLKEEGISYTYELRYIKDIKGKCWKVERYFAHFPGKKDFEIDEKQYKKAEKKQ